MSEEVKRYKHIHMVKGIRLKDRKTDQFTVLSNSSGAPLGVVKWYSPWRQYCLCADDSIWSHECLADVWDFLLCLKRKEL